MSNIERRAPLEQVCRAPPASDGNDDKDDEDAAHYTAPGASGHGRQQVLAPEPEAERLRVAVPNIDSAPAFPTILPCEDSQMMMQKTSEPRSEDAQFGMEDSQLPCEDTQLQGEESQAAQMPAASSENSTLR